MIMVVYGDLGTGSGLCAGAGYTSDDDRHAFQLSSSTDTRKRRKIRSTIAIDIAHPAMFRPPASHPKRGHFHITFGSTRSPMMVGVFFFGTLVYSREVDSYSASRPFGHLRKVL